MQARGDEKEVNVAKAEKIALNEAERVGLAWLKAPSSTHNGACVEIASALIRKRRVTDESR